MHGGAAAGAVGGSIQLLSGFSSSTSSGDMQLQQPLDINQLLDGIEGVYVSREGGPGGVNSVSIRGAEPNFTVVLVDGVALNDPTNTRGAPSIRPPCRPIM